MRSNLMNDARNPVHRFLVLLAEDVFGVSQSLAGENSCKCSGVDWSRVFWFAPLTCLQADVDSENRGPASTEKYGDFLSIACG